MNNGQLTMDNALAAPSVRWDLKTLVPLIPSINFHNPSNPGDLFPVYFCAFPAILLTKVEKGLTKSAKHG